MLSEVQADNDFMRAIGSHGKAVNNHTSTDALFHLMWALRRLQRLTSVLRFTGRSGQPEIECSYAAYAVRIHEPGMKWPEQSLELDCPAKLMYALVLQAILGREFIASIYEPRQ